MKNVKCIIVEDERLAREELKRLLEAHTFIDIIEEAVNVSDGIKKINTLNPDLIFLDINMPGNKTGFDLLEELEYSPAVIFTTAYDQYAIKAFEVNALDYLLKPIDENRLAEALLKVQKNTKESAQISNGKKLSVDDKVFVKDGERCWFVRIGDVRYFESAGNYSKVVFENHKPMILRSLNALEEKLDEHIFFRANRKQIINIEFIKNIHPHFNGGLKVLLNSGEEVEISRRQAVAFKEKMSL